MNKEQLFGMLRALLAWIGGQAIGHGIVTANVWALIAGVVMAGATAGYAYFVVHDLTMDSVLGLVRALLAAAGGILEPLGILPPGAMAQAANGAALLIPALWSAYSHRPQAANPGEGGIGRDPAGGSLASIALAVCVLPVLFLALAGCQSSQSKLSIDDARIATIIACAVGQAVTGVAADVSEAQVLAAGGNPSDSKTLAKWKAGAMLTATECARMQTVIDAIAAARAAK